MTTRRRRLGLGLIVAALAAANLAMITGDSPRQSGSRWWNNYHWNRSTVRLLVNSSSASRTPSLRAANAWGRMDLSVTSSSVHSDISLFDGDYGSTGWRGLASPWVYSDGAFSHCHARLNRFYTSAPPGKTTEWRWEGTYCMELGHCYGLAHDGTKGCMNGFAMNGGYANTPSDDNIAAINAKY